MAEHFQVGNVSVEVLDDTYDFIGVPTSQWHGDKTERTGAGMLANLKSDDGLRAQVVLVTWPGGDEVSLRMADLFGGPADYERLENAGELAPKKVGDMLVARIRALRYSRGRASLAAVEWSDLDDWAGEDAQALLTDLGATRAGTYGDLFSEATRFKTEPAIEVPVDNPAALFAVYALTRVIPIMIGFGKASVEGPNA